MATYDSLTDKQKLAFLLQEDKFPYFTDEQLGWLIDLYTVEGVLSIYLAAIHGIRLKKKEVSFNIGDLQIQNTNLAGYWDDLVLQYTELNATVGEDTQTVFNIHHIFTPNLIEN